MIKTNKINIILIIILSILLITIISFSFAAFTTKITNNETNTTIATGSGIMEITYSSGENINAPNIFPREEPFITKEFTITGNNSNPTENMYYHLFLVLDENTFRRSALTYTLESNNEDDNGYVVPEIITQTGIKTGEREIFLGNGMFTPTNKENKVHSYTLKLYFPKIEHFDHGVDQGKTFKAHIETKEGETYPGYNTEKGVNHPVLFTGMKPIVWDENNTESFTTEDDPSWYDYNEKRWANAKSADGSYWVWIPRYAYKIETCYHTSGEDCEALTGKQAGDIDVKFLKSTTNLTEDSTTIESTGYEAHVKDTSMRHFLHPAFQFNGEELGFWIAKFEPTAHEELFSGALEGSCSEFDNVSNKSPFISPNLTSWRCINVSNAYKVSLAMKDNPIYGWYSNEVDTHMMKNVEWGAVTYLSKSKYGAHEEEVWNNSYIDFVTGCSGSSVSAVKETTCVTYETENGLKASTTHNIYGVYDMSGGTAERVMANYNNLPALSGFDQSGLLSLEKKYTTHYYTPPEEMLGGRGMQYNSNIYGDAIFETSKNANRYDGSVWENIGSSWNDNMARLPHKGASWIDRGGNSTVTDGRFSGIYNFNIGQQGRAHHIYSFRPVLTPL